MQRDSGQARTARRVPCAAPSRRASCSRRTTAPMCGARAADSSPCDRCRRPSSWWHQEESYRAGRYAEIASAVPVRTAIARDRLQRLRPLAPAGAGDVGAGEASGGYRGALSTFQGCRDYGPRFCGRPGTHAASKSPVTSGIPAVFETIGKHASRWYFSDYGGGTIPRRDRARSGWALDCRSRGASRCDGIGATREEALAKAEELALRAIEKPDLHSHTAKGVRTPSCPTQRAARQALCARHALVGRDA